MDGDLAALHACIDQQLRDHQVDASYRAFVLAHLDRSDDGWRWCCGSNCDPCVERLGRVVDAVRRLRGLPRPGPAGGPRSPG